jgi:hypothetical protein
MHPGCQIDNPAKPIAFKQRTAVFGFFPVISMSGFEQFCSPLNGF